jgi:hypothetical protein
MIVEVKKHFQGGSWTMYARLPKGVRLSQPQWREQFELWGEATNGGHEEGYRMYAKGVRKIPEEAKWLEFNEDILSKIGATKAPASRSGRPKALSPVSNAASAAVAALVPSGSGTLPTRFAPSSSPLGAAGMAVPSTARSSTVANTKSWPRRSALAVALRSTPTGRGSFGLAPTRDTVASLTALLVALLRETTSGDKVALATYAAEGLAKGFGVPQDEFDRVVAAVTAKWRGIAATDPMHKAFGTGRMP